MVYTRHGHCPPSREATPHICRSAYIPAPAGIRMEPTPTWTFATQLARLRWCLQLTRPRLVATPPPAPAVASSLLRDSQVDAKLRHGELSSE
jgi:hypothetical protein